MANKPTRIAAFYRYGTDVAEPRAMLEALVTAHPWQSLKTHRDTAASRPELKKLQASAMAAKLGVIMVADLNQVGNSALEVIERAAWLDAQGVHLCSMNPPLDTGMLDGRKQMALIRHLADYQGDIRRRHAKGRTPRRPPGGARRKLQAEHAAASRRRRSHGRALWQTSVTPSVRGRRAAPEIRRHSPRSTVAGAEPTQ
jgi:DNA invertase Pin-like site-specific DNA recombinase